MDECVTIKSRCHILSKSFYIAAIATLVLLSLSYAIPSILFFFKIEINRIYLPLFFGGSFFVPLCLKNESKLIKLVSLTIFIAVIGFSIWLSLNTFDTTFDGNTYHKTAVGAMQYGWNPVYERAEEFFERIKMTLGECSTFSIWIDHYGNASWVMGSVFACFFSNIEAGKAINLQAAFALFGLLQYYLYNKKISYSKSFLISILTVINPITICQFTNFYLDGSLMMYLFIGILALLMLSDRSWEHRKKESVFLLTIAIMLCGNIKFTGLAYIAFFCISFEILWLIWSYKKNRFMEVLKKSLLYYSTTVIISFIILGYPSFIQNIQETGQPLYPVAGENSVEIVSTHEAVEFKNRTNIEKFFISNFSNISSQMGGNAIPKSWSGILYDLKNGTINPDTRLSGYGPIFHIILLLSFLICGLGIIKVYKSDKFLFWQFLTIYITSILLIVFMPGSWYARYCPHEYLFVIFGLIYLAKVEKVSISMCFVGLSLLLMLNVQAFGKVAYFDLRVARNINKQYEVVIEHQRKERDIGYILFDNYAFTGVLFNLKDKNISYKDAIVDNEKKEDAIPLYEEQYNKVYYIP